MSNNYYLKYLDIDALKYLIFMNTALLQYTMYLFIEITIVLEESSRSTRQKSQTLQSLEKKQCYYTEEYKK